MGGLIVPPPTAIMAQRPYNALKILLMVLVGVLGMVTIWILGGRELLGLVGGLVVPLLLQ